jgi:hypothetical protein
MQSMAWPAGDAIRLGVQRLRIDPVFSDVLCARVRNHHDFRHRLKRDGPCCSRIRRDDQISHLSERH